MTTLTKPRPLHPHLTNKFATIQHNVNVLAITWEKLQQATSDDLETLSSLIRESFPIERKHECSADVIAFWPYRNSLHLYDGVFLYKDRIVIPRSLQNNALESLHAAHQGCSSMNITAESTVFWPNITRNIEITRQLCKWCNQKLTKNSTSHTNHSNNTI